MKSYILIGLLMLAEGLVGATISISPASPVVNLGDPVTVNLVLDATAQDLYGYQFSLGFDPTVLQAVSVTDGGLLGLTGNFSGGTVDNTAGTLTLVFDFLNGSVPGVAGPGTLASVGFQAIGVGVSTVDFLPTGDLVLSDSLGLELQSNGVGAQVQVVGAEIPEPASLGFLMIGLAAGMAWAKRRGAGR